MTLNWSGRGSYRELNGAEFLVVVQFEGAR